MTDSSFPCLCYYNHNGMTVLNILLCFEEDLERFGPWGFFRFTCGGLHKFPTNLRTTSKFVVPEMWRGACFVLSALKYYEVPLEIHWPIRWETKRGRQYNRLDKAFWEYHGNSTTWWEYRWVFCNAEWRTARRWRRLRGFDSESKVNGWRIVMLGWWM